MKVIFDSTNRFITKQGDSRVCSGYYLVNDDIFDVDDPKLDGGWFESAGIPGSRSNYAVSFAYSRILELLRIPELSDEGDEYFQLIDEIKKQTGRNPDRDSFRCEISGDNISNLKVKMLYCPDDLTPEDLTTLVQEMEEWKDSLLDSAERCDDDGENEEAKRLNNRQFALKKLIEKVKKLPGYVGEDSDEDEDSDEEE